MSPACLQVTPGLSMGCSWTSCPQWGIPETHFNWQLFVLITASLSLKNKAPGAQGAAQHWQYPGKNLCLKNQNVSANHITFCILYLITTVYFVRSPTRTQDEKESKCRSEGKSDGKAGLRRWLWQEPTSQLHLSLTKPACKNSSDGFQL